MALLSSTRAVGVIGSIMVVLFVLPGVGSALAVIGWILVIVAAYLLSQHVNDRAIFNNVLIAAILAIVGFVVLVAVALTSVLRFAGINGMALSSLANINRTAVASGSLHGLGGLIIGVVAGLALLWVFLLASALFLRRSYDEIARKFNVRMFSTAALVYLIGAALTIILVGLVVVFVAGILQAIAFYSLPDQLPSQVERPVPMTVPPPPPQQY
jgi:uncharacterized membrane protein